MNNEDLRYLRVLYSELGYSADKRSLTGEEIERVGGFKQTWTNI